MEANLSSFKFRSLGMHMDAKHSKSNLQQSTCRKMIGRAIHEAVSTATNKMVLWVVWHQQTRTCRTFAIHRTSLSGRRSIAKASTLPCDRPTCRRNRELLEDLQSTLQAFSRCSLLLRGMALSRSCGLELTVQLGVRAARSRATGRETHST